MKVAILANNYEVRGLERTKITVPRYGSSDIYLVDFPSLDCFLDWLSTVYAITISDDGMIWEGEYVWVINVMEKPERRED